MTDKEVGELWNTPMLMPTRRYVEQLIRKVVEERAYAWTAYGAINRPPLRAEWVQLALRDFGIDPATWGEK